MFWKQNKTRKPTIPLISTLTLNNNKPSNSQLCSCEVLRNQSLKWKYRPEHTTQGGLSSLTRIPMTHKEQDSHTGWRTWPRITIGGEVDSLRGQWWRSRAQMLRLAGGFHVQEAPRGESAIFVGVQKSLLQQSLTGQHPTEKAMEELKRALRTIPPGWEELLYPHSWGLFLYFSDTLVLVSLI